MFFKEILDCIKFPTIGRFWKSIVKNRKRRRILKNPTQKQRVERYLNRLMKGRYFTVDDLMSLSVTDLKRDTPILDVGRSTISQVLGSFKTKYSEKASEKKIDKKKSQKKPKSPPDKNGLQSDEISKLRQMLQWYEKRDKQEFLEFEELKLALEDIGIDYLKILKKYRDRIF